MNQTKVQGIVLDIEQNSLANFKAQLSSFRDAELNQTKSLRIHLTLTIFSFDDESECASKLIPILDKFAQNLSSLNIQVSEPKAVGSDYIALEVISDELHLKHLELIEAISPFTKDHFNPKYLNHNLSDIEVSYLHKYGYHRVREFYNPHITIGKYSTTEIRDQQLILAPKISGPFIFNRIYLDSCIDGSGIPSTILWEKDLK